MEERDKSKEFSPNKEKASITKKLKIAMHRLQMMQTRTQLEH